MGKKTRAIGAILTTLLLGGCHTAAGPAIAPAADHALASDLVAPAAFGGRPATLDGERLSVLSFNMQHRTKERELDALAEHLKQDLPRVPDFILCQEVVFKGGNRPTRSDTATSLARRLGFHSRGTKRTSDREGVAIISRYPFAYYDDLHLKARTNGLLLGFRRVSAMGEFIVPSIGRVRVVDVHFAHWPFEGHIRRQQLEETLSWIADRDAIVPADLTLLGGDFNAKPTWDELDPLGDLAMTGGLVYQNWNQPGLLTKGSPGRPVKRIDYIFVASPARRIELAGEQALCRDGLRRANGARFWPSDHVPLLHEYVVDEALQLTGVED